MKTRFLDLPLLAALVALSSSAANAQGPSAYGGTADFAKYATKLRENMLLNLEPRVILQTSRSAAAHSSRYPWKNGIVTTTFWVGESASQNNPVHNHSSSWDVNWGQNFGGYDNPDPSARRDYIPKAFVPRQNPFYFALPYNDVTRGSTKPEAKVVIPWFKTEFVREGLSICRDRWIAIRANNKICYAQWSDCGPFRTDHWQYVFQDERPKPNLNKGAGLDVSPAVRDYLEIAGTDVTDWRFVEFNEVPPGGPWARYGDNNHFVINARNGNTRRADARGATLPPPPPAREPTVVIGEK